MKSHFTNDDFDFINRLFAAKKGVKFTVDEPKEKIREVYIPKEIKVIEKVIDKEENDRLKKENNKLQKEFNNLKSEKEAKCINQLIVRIYL